MIATLLLTLFPLLARVPFVRGQQAGNFLLNATVPSPATSGSGCIILGQLTIATTTTIEALNPICPSTAGEYASLPLTGVNISWPFRNNGDSYSSSMAIYAGITHEDGNESPDDKSGQTNPYQAKATCVLQLTEDQVQYLLGRSLTWNNHLNELWDNIPNGFVMNGTEGGPLGCANASLLLPADLWLPDPYAYAAGDETWRVAMTIPSSDSKSISTSSPASSMASLVPVVSASSSDSMTTTDSASSSSSSALIAVATATRSTSTSDSMSTLISASTTSVDSTSAPFSISSANASSTNLVSRSAFLSSSSSPLSSTLSTSISNSAFTSTAVVAIATDEPTVVSSIPTGWSLSTPSSVSATNSVSVSESTSSSSSTFVSRSTSAPFLSSTYISSVSSTSLKSTATLSATAAGTTTAAATGGCVPVTITQIITTTVTASPDKRQFYGLI